MPGMQDDGVFAEVGLVAFHALTDGGEHCFDVWQVGRLMFTGRRIARVLTTCERDALVEAASVLGLNIN
jgi:hypothetical protein